MQIAKVNEILKQCREQKRYSLHSIHQATRISIQYLQALESGQWNVFPAEVYVLGFLRKYAVYLGLNPETIVEQYKNEMEQQHTQEQESHKKELEVQKQIETRSLVKGALFAGLILTFVIWRLYVAVKAFHTESPKTKSQPVQLMKGMSNPTTSQSDQLQLEIQSLGQVWIRVIADSQLVFEGLLPLGAARSWESKNDFTIRIGNVEMVKVVLNGLPINVTVGAHQSVNDIKLNRDSLQTRSFSKPQDATSIHFSTAVENRKKG